MDVKVIGIIAIIDTLKQEPDELKLEALRAQAEAKYRFDQRVPVDGLVFTAQTLTTIASNYHQVETLVGVPA